MSDQRHSYADHPAALILADHQSRLHAWTKVPGVGIQVSCRCNHWFGWDYDHPAHLAEVLHRAGQLADGPPPVTLTERILAERAARRAT